VISDTAQLRLDVFICFQSYLLSRSGGGPMHGASQLKLEEQLHSGTKPVLISLDSGNECSLDHWLEVYWLVEEEYVFARDSDCDTWPETTNKAN
jgi:hypothetical protein